VLIVEKDYIQSEHCRHLLSDAGAIVIGPANCVADAAELCGRWMPDCALIDINLGKGPSFDLALALQICGVPVVVLTGHDATTIPDDLAEVTFVQKPATARSVITAVRTASGR
jgi:DNA-binding NarL/FixJ family response regulator